MFHRFQLSQFQTDDGVGGGCNDANGDEINSNALKATTRHVRQLFVIQMVTPGEDHPHPFLSRARTTRLTFSVVVLESWEMKADSRW